MSQDGAIDQAAIDAGARALEAGQLVAFPTETVYGLGADAENPAAVAAIYAAKGRPQDHPVIVHLAPEADMAHWACEIPPEAHALAEAFWPGPLTMILKRAPNIPDAVSGGQDTVGLRCPSHPVAIALLRAFKGGQGGVGMAPAATFARRRSADDLGAGEDPSATGDGALVSVKIIIIIIKHSHA